MHDVQSWLVSAGQQGSFISSLLIWSINITLFFKTEKDAARELIENALKGLQENGRIQIDDDGKNSNFHVNLDDIKETIER